MLCSYSLIIFEGHYPIFNIFTSTSLENSMRFRSILIFISIHLSVFAQRPVMLTDYMSQEAVSDFQIYYHYDSTCTLDGKKVFLPENQQLFQQLDFEKIRSESKAFVTGECFWFRLIVYNQSQNNLSFHLQPNIFSSFDQYTLYQRFRNNHLTERISGKQVRPRFKDINISGTDDLRFFIEPGQADTLMLRVKTSKDSVLSDLTFSISTHDSVIGKDRSRRVTFGIFVGIMVIMILYHILLYLQVRERSYLYYIFYILAFLSFFINKEGYIYELIPQFTSAPLNTLLMQIFLLCFLLFGRSYLETEKYIKEWDIILLLAVWFTFLGLIVSFTTIILSGLGLYLPYFVQVAAMSINIIAAVGSLFLAIMPAFILKKKRFQPARYFLIANIFLILGVVVLFVFNKYTIGKHGLEIGVTLQILTFSVGLGEKINHLKRDRERAQHRIIDQLKENAALKDKVNRELEDKVRERTHEIQMQKEQIERQNKEIKYSFDYAKKIQSTVLPRPEIFDNLFSEHFIFFKPKDIVSGDFYWISQKDQKIFLTAADCTGHGVPGSLMSMLGITMLHEIVNEKNYAHSEEILNQLRNSITRTLKQEGKPGEQKDGMDMVLLIYDHVHRQLEFSGANNPIYIVRNGEMMEFKGNNMPVAYYDNMTDFTRVTIQLEKDDRVYLFTDGFPDQFGGPEGKKFKYKPFKDLLLEIHNRSMDEQEKILQLVFKEWMGDLDQIDDVLVIGLRF